MSRSNYDKPFYVDVGTSIVAVRCASNHDVVLRHDHIRLPQTIQLAEDACDRMNKEAEISKPLRNCDVGTADEQAERQSRFCVAHHCGPGCPAWRDGQAHNGCVLAWAQMPYAQEGGAK